MSAVLNTPQTQAAHRVDAVIVGAGFSGLYQLHQLRDQLGLNVLVLEAGEGVGGTWFWNRYPGARCDVESLDYSFSFDEALQQEWVWSERYPVQAEILRYLNHVADRFDLRRDIRHGVRVVAQAYDAAAHAWTVTTQQGETLTARFCIMATGNLSTPQLPAIPGIEQFQGEWHHSARWPAEGVDFTGRRVAQIGTGSTGIQMAPRIAAQAAHLFVFQRTPHFSVPAWNGPLDEEVQRNHKKTYAERRQDARRNSVGISGIVPPTQGAQEAHPEERQRRYEAGWSRGGSVAFMSAYNDLMLDQQSNDTAAAFVRGKIAEIVHDPHTARLLSPTDDPIGARRLCVDTDYYATFNRPNVTLVDGKADPVVAIDATGIRTRDTHYPVDAIAFATGFDAMTGALKEIAITGEDGLSLAEAWTFGPVTYLGLMVAGFPNMFIVTGPGSPSVRTNMVSAIEQHVEWIADCIGHLNANGLTRLAARPEEQERWVAHVTEVADRTLYPKANSWYVGANTPGKPRVFMPYIAGLPAYRAKCDEVAAQRYASFDTTPPAG